MFFKRYKNKKTEKGFTIIELMVVLVIIVALAILIISGYQEGRPRLAVERGAEELVGIVNMAKSRSFHGILYDDEGEIVGGGHGIHIREDGYDFFYFNKDSEKSSIMEIEFDDFLFIEAEPLDGNTLTIYFEESDVYFNGEKAGAEDEARIVFIAKSDEDITREVVINHIGITEIVY